MYVVSAIHYVSVHIIVLLMSCFCFCCYFYNYYSIGWGLLCESAGCNSEGIIRLMCQCHCLVKRWLSCPVVYILCYCSHWRYRRFCTSSHHVNCHTATVLYSWLLSYKWHAFIYCVQTRAVEPVSVGGVRTWYRSTDSIFYKTMQNLKRTWIHLLHCLSFFLYLCFFITMQIILNWF